MKNWNAHVKLHAILKHQQKIQAEIDEKQNPIISGLAKQSLSQLRDKMYRPTKSGDAENPKENNSPKAAATSPSAAPTAIYSTSPGRSSRPSPGISHSSAYPARLSHITQLLRSKILQWTSGPQRYIALIVALVLVMVLMQIHIWAAYGGVELPAASRKEEDRQDGPRIVNVDTEDSAVTIENLISEIKALKEQVRQHEQQIKYILPRFVEQKPQKTEEGVPQIIDDKDLPQDLVAEPDKKASIKARGANSSRRKEAPEDEDPVLPVKSALASVDKEKPKTGKANFINPASARGAAKEESKIGVVAKETGRDVDAGNAGIINSEHQV